MDLDDYMITILTTCGWQTNTVCILRYIILACRAVNFDQFLLIKHLILYNLMNENNIEILYDNDEIQKRYYWA